VLRPFGDYFPEKALVFQFAANLLVVASYAICRFSSMWRVLCSTFAPFRSSEFRDLTRDCYGPCFCVTATLDTLLSRNFAEIGHFYILIKGLVPKFTCTSNPLSGRALWDFSDPNPLYSRIFAGKCHRYIFTPTRTFPHHQVYQTF